MKKSLTLLALLTMGTVFATEADAPKTPTNETVVTQETSPTITADAKTETTPAPQAKSTEEKSPCGCPR